MDRSDTLANLLKALVEAKKSFKKINHDCIAKIPFKNGTGHKEYSYASLDHIIDQIQGALLANGLTLSHAMDRQDNVWKVFTYLFHVSGEWMRVCIQKKSEVDLSFQETGSLLTYFRRYGIASLLGIPTDQDTDGDIAEAAEKAQEPYKNLPPLEEKPKVSSKEVEDKFWAMIPSGTSKIKSCEFVDSIATRWNTSDIEVKQDALARPSEFLAELKKFLDKNT